jgi:hypothetical protein
MGSRDGEMVSEMGQVLLCSIALRPNCRDELPDAADLQAVDGKETAFAEESRDMSICCVARPDPGAA